MAGVSVKFNAEDNVSSKLESIYNAGQKVSRQYEEVESAVNSALEALGETANQTASEVISVADAQNYWTDALGNYDESAMLATNSLKDLVDAGYMTEDVLTDMADALKDTQEKTEDFGEKTKESVVGLDDVLATVGIVAALKEIESAFEDCSTAASEYETNVAMLATIADATVLSADQLSQQIKATSRDTAQSVNDLAISSYNAISAGVDTADAVATVGQATELAVAGFTDTASALSVLTTATNAYQLEASEMANISDSLIVSQNLGVMTIDQLSSSIGKAISTASAYSVDLYNLESGYISLTKAGISVEESTTYISGMFNELGDSGSEVAKIIKEETGESFGQLMNDGYSLADVLGILYESVDQDSEALMNLWGSAEAGKAANAVINQGLETFNDNLITLKNSSGATAAAYETMTNTSAYATQRLQNSMDNLQIAIGDDLNPAISEFKNGLADVIDEASSLIEKHPAITAGITAVTVALAAVTVGIGGYTAATKIAALATTAWTAVMNVNPIFLAVTAVAALTAGIVAFTAVMGDSVDEYDTWTEATQRQYDELQSLNQEYQNAVDVYGETSEEALRLKYQVDDLTDSFESNKQTLEEFWAECDSVIDSSQRMIDNYEANKNGLHENEIRTQALIQKLEDLAASTDTSAGKQQQMEAVIAELNATVDGLNLSYDDLINNQGMAITSLRAYAEMQAKQERMQSQYQAYVDAISEEASIREKLAEATANQTVEQERYNQASEEYFQYAKMITASDSTGFAGLGLAFSDQYKELDAAEKAYEETTERVDGLTEKLNEALRVQKECEDAWSELSASAEDSADKQIDSGEAVVEVITENEEALTELAKAYDAAYESAMQSVRGQYGLWDEVESVVSMSRRSIEDALQSQIDYWTSYNSNLESLSDRAGDIKGLSDMLAHLSDGSEDSAAMLAGMEKMNDADLSAVVQQYTDLQTAQSATATSMADLSADFSTKLDEMVKTMEDSVQDMNMEDDAKAAAKATMDAYVEEIKTGVANAQLAIDSLSFAKTNAFGGASVTKGYAVGTRDADPGLALVGEEGPELINFGGGEVVYTADETENIMDRSSSVGDFYVDPEKSDEGSSGSGDKTITLKVEGGGEMKVTGNGVSKEDVVSLILENVKDALMNIVQQEMEEEGDLAYEF